MYDYIGEELYDPGIGGISRFGHSGRPQARGQTCFDTTDIRTCDGNTLITTCNMQTTNTVNALVAQLTAAGYGGPWDLTSCINWYNSVAVGCDCAHKPATGCTSPSPTPTPTPNPTGGGNIPWLPIIGVGAVVLVVAMVAGQPKPGGKILVAKNTV